MKVPITRVDFSDDTAREVADVIKSGWIAQGPKVKEFEDSVKAVTGSAFAVCVSSGTAALHLSLVAEGIGEGDEVIVPSFSFIASANSVLYAGAKPVFCDVCMDTYNMDASKLEALITNKTKAIMPVHQFGLSCDLDAIYEIADKHGIKVIEDAACALGSSYKGKMIGKTSSCASFSFHPRKITTSAEGGMITTDSERIADTLYKLRNHGDELFGISSGSGVEFPYFYKTLGFNYRMTDMQAVLGISQMKRLEGFIKRRGEIAVRYNEAFDAIEPLSTPVFPQDGSVCNFQSYMMCLKNSSGLSRDGIVKQLIERGVGAKAGIPPIHLQKFYIDSFGACGLPVTEELSRNSFFLPIFPSMTEEEFNYVVKSVKDVFGI